MLADHFPSGRDDLTVRIQKPLQLVYFDDDFVALAGDPTHAIPSLLDAARGLAVALERGLVIRAAPYRPIVMCYPIV